MNTLENICENILVIKNMSKSLIRKAISKYQKQSKAKMTFCEWDILFRV